MKIIALLVLALLLASFGCARAEREHFKTEQFDISFEMNKAHEVGYEFNGIKMKTPDGNLEIKVLHDQSGLPSNSFDNMVNYVFHDESDLSYPSFDQMVDQIGRISGGVTENVLIDGVNGGAELSNYGGIKLTTYLKSLLPA